MKGSLRAVFFLFFFSGIFSGCLAQQVPFESIKLPVPTKDDVALVNGRPLSLNDFLNIRSALKNPSNQNAFWAGTASLALQDESRNRGKVLPLRTAFEIVQYALGELPESQVTTSVGDYYRSPSLSKERFPRPAQVRKDVEALLGKAQIQKSTHLLSQIF